MAILNGTDLNDTINGTALADLVFGNGGNDWLRGHGGNDIIRGGSGNDILEGGAGDDILFGDSGSNSLFGGDGSDILVSGTGSDHFNGGAGIDAASWQESSFAVVADLNTGRGTSGGVQDTFTLIENLIGSRFGDTLIGNAGNNGLFGGDGADRLFGGAGNDELSGGSGNDTLDGGAGINRLKGGAGVDTVDYRGQAGPVEVDLGQGQTIGHDRIDILSEVEAIHGSNHADRLFGNAFGNRLSGNGGNDWINGGEGNDTLTGGAGADVFEFVAFRAGKVTRESNSGFDRITDFNRAQGDVIDLTGHKEATTFAALRASASQFGDDTHLRLGVDTVVLEDVALRDLSAAMFMF